MQLRCPISTIGVNCGCLAPIAAVCAVDGRLSLRAFLAPIRRDVATIVERIERAAPAGDSKLKEHDKSDRQISRTDA